MTNGSRPSRTLSQRLFERRLSLHWLGGPIVILLLAVPPARTGLESSMPGHMLVQMPLLILAGSLIGIPLRPTFASLLDRYDAYGIASILIGVFALAFWMLPRSLDAALAEPAMEAMKFLTVPGLVGVPVALAWPRLPAVARGFVFGNCLSMLAVLGWLYLAAPVRVCNFYLSSDQALTGKGLLLLAAVAGLYWLLSAFGGEAFSDDEASNRCRSNVLRSSRTR
jgi:hypothetical protein